MLYYKVTNRTTRKSLILNESEFVKFFCKNNFRDYATEKTLSPKDQQINDFINTIAISLFSVAMVVFISNVPIKSECYSL